MSFAPRNVALRRLEVCFLILFVGLRHEVGGDWEPYLANFNRIGQIPLNELISITYATIDIGYYFLGALVYKLGGTIHLANLVYALLSISGLYLFSGQFKHRDYVFICYYPYIIVVFAMGYTRQSVAVSLIILAFCMVNQKFRFFLMSVLAITFHKSVILLNIYNVRSKTALLFVFAFSIMILGIFSDIFLLLHTNYIQSGKASSGFLYRLILFSPFLLIFFISRRKKIFIYSNKPLEAYYYYCTFIFFLLIICISAFSSTVADRYLIVLMIFVIPYSLTQVAALDKSLHIPVVFLLWCYNTGSLLVWFMTANNAASWIPYTFYIF